MAARARYGGAAETGSRGADVAAVILEVRRRRQGLGPGGAALEVGVGALESGSGGVVPFFFLFYNVPRT
jgi:hypothetical protein